MEQKMIETSKKYLECANKAMDEYLNGNEINKDDVYALGDVIRTMHHIKSMFGASAAGYNPQNNQQQV
jgi:hypothetical protein